MTIWFSASCSLTILPNSVGLPALPLRMISVDGSNRLRSLPSTCVSPPKMRARVCFITCRTRGTISSSLSTQALQCELLHNVCATTSTPSAISLAKRFAWPTTRLVELSTWR